LKAKANNNILFLLGKSNFFERLQIKISWVHAMLFLHEVSHQKEWLFNPKKCNSICNLLLFVNKTLNASVVHSSVGRVLSFNHEGPRFKTR
jgi:hypothetical protein